MKRRDLLGGVHAPPQIRVAKTRGRSYMDQVAVTRNMAQQLEEFSLERLVFVLAGMSPLKLCTAVELGDGDWKSLTRMWEDNARAHGRHVEGGGIDTLMGLPIVRRPDFPVGYGEVVNSDGSRVPIRFGGVDPNPGQA